MKKIYLALAAAAIAASAQAQNFSTEKVATVNSWAAFTADGSMRPVNLTINDENGTATAEIYNSDLTPDTRVTFAVPAGMDQVFDLDLNGLRVGITQHLFNDDDAYEIVCYRVIADGDLFANELHVIGQNGDDLGIIPSNSLVTTGSDTFIEERIVEDGITAGYNYYTIEKSSAGVQEIARPAAMMMAPNPAAPGETVTLTLPEAADGTAVEVYDTAGRLQLRTVTSDGTATIPASKVATGVNPVVIKTDGKITPAGKLIVK